MPDDPGPVIDTQRQLAYLSLKFLRPEALPHVPITDKPTRLKILFTSAQHSSFISDDLELLRRHFDVEHIITRGVRSLFTIRNSLAKSDVTFTWFASVYASIVVFLARRSGRRSLICVGGVDVAKYPEINYGVWLSRWKSILVKYAIRNATKILVVDPFQIGEAKRLAAYDGGNIEYVPTGYDPEKWFPSGGKEAFVLTIAKCETESRLRVKGLDFLFSTAQTMPDVRFVVVGLAEKLVHHVRLSVPTNVEVVPFLEQDLLLGYYQRAKVYCQPSYIEGLPNSVCEAMLCECIPVGTNVGGIPTAIKDHGFLVPFNDADALRGAIKKALYAPPRAGTAARNSIAETFTLARREETLLRLLRESTS